MTKRPFTRKRHRAKEPLEPVHSNLCGPIKLKQEEGLNISSLLLMIIQDMGIFI